jgi:high affinity Mn2+ porin
MKDRRFFPILTAAIIVSISASYAAIADEATVQVVATGIGVDAEKALKSAFSNALQQAIGLVADAETIVKNDQVIRDQVLAHSDAYIEKYDTVSQGKNADDLVEVKIKATVRRRQLVEKLVAAKVIAIPEPAAPSAARERAAPPEPSAPAVAAVTPPAKEESENFTVHAQATYIAQKHDHFSSPYAGPNSLKRDEAEAESVTATLFTGVRLPWEGGALFFDPELSGGQGLSSVKGIADFPNGDIARVSTSTPEAYIARLYYQQVFGLGGEREKIASDQNQLAGSRDVSRITLSLGKFSATDFFDNNTYAHDPRNQFMNWGLVANGAWDYPADTRGYTYGGVIELNQPRWALRYGVFAEPTEANGPDLDWHLPEAVGQALELEKRWSIQNHPGVVRLLSFLNCADMGVYQKATENPGPNGPDVTATRGYHVKYGFGLNAEQALTDNLGAFCRLGWNDGRAETWAYTEVDETASIGLSLKGALWKRPDDVLGLAGIISGLSSEHREYLEAGGLGFEIGDGRLAYSPEEVIEVYYDWKVVDHVFVTPDFQFVNNPAYNSDRGPVAIWGLRVHAEF